MLIIFVAILTMHTRAMYITLGQVINATDAAVPDHMMIGGAQRQGQTVVCVPVLDTGRLYAGVETCKARQKDNDNEMRRGGLPCRQLSKTPLTKKT